MLLNRKKLNIFTFFIQPKTKNKYHLTCNKHSNHPLINTLNKKNWTSQANMTEEPMNDKCVLFFKNNNNNSFKIIESLTRSGTLYWFNLKEIIE